MKISKNNVSYFEAGFKAAMVLFGGLSTEEVTRRFHSTTVYPNLMRECLRYYDSSEFHDDGAREMLRNL